MRRTPPRRATVTRRRRALRCAHNSVARLTALRRSRPGRIALEVDGRPWRLVPDEVVVRCGLVADVELTRPLLRDLRRELHRAEAIAVSTGAVAHRDLSRRQLEGRLASRGVAPDTGAEALAVLA